MTIAEQRVIALALKIQAHRDRIADIRSRIQRCEVESGGPEGEEPCYYEGRDGRGGAQDFNGWCDACKANFPLLVEKRMEQGKANGALRRLTEWSRKVRAEREPGPYVGDPSMPQHGPLEDER